jgi:hypothetical protein
MQYINNLAVALAIAAIPSSLAQTFSACDPTKKCKVHAFRLVFLQY